MIERIRSSFAYRGKWAKFGVYYFRSLELKSVRVAGRRVNLRFPLGEREVLQYELSRVLFDDCYGLATIRSHVGTVLDIGANVGLFAIAARHFFPGAQIHCYEPNPALEEYIAAHCEAIDCEYHLAAVGADSGRVRLKPRDNSLHTLSEQCADGESVSLSFAEAVARLDTVDLLKLDCEGCEWEIFSRSEPWLNVREVVMEYHLWARPGATEAFLRQELSRLGFGSISIFPSACGPWGFAHASRV